MSALQSPPSSPSFSAVLSQSIELAEGAGVVSSHGRIQRETERDCIQRNDQCHGNGLSGRCDHARFCFISYLPLLPNTHSILSSFHYQWEHALALFRSIKREGLQPDVIVFSATISALGKCGQWEIARGEFGCKLSTLTLFCKSNAHTYSPLTSRIIIISDLFEEMKSMGIEPNVHAYSATISAFEKGGQWQEALRLFSEMQASDVQPNLITFNATISAQEKGRQWQHALTLFDDLKRRGLKPNVITYSATISALEKGGEWQQALRLFDEMKASNLRPNVVTYNAVIGALKNGGQWQRALGFLAEMRALRLKPNIRTFNTLISAMRIGDQWQHAVELHASIHLTELTPDLDTFNATLLVLEASGPWELALKVFDDLCASALQPNATTYCAVVAALRRCGQWTRAWQVYRHCVDTSELTPPPTLISDVLLAMCGAAVGSDARRAAPLALELLAAAPRPDATMFAAAASVLDAAGDAQRALIVISNMQHQVGSITRVASANHYLPCLVAKNCFLGGFSTFFCYFKLTLHSFPRLYHGRACKWTAPRSPCTCVRRARVAVTMRLRTRTHVCVPRGGGATPRRWTRRWRRP
jgi:pentatricopeptide repeat domain-containing protein 1